LQMKTKGKIFYSPLPAVQNTAQILACWFSVLGDIGTLKGKVPTGVTDLVSYLHNLLHCNYVHLSKAESACLVVSTTPFHLSHRLAIYTLCRSQLEKRDKEVGTGTPS